MRGREEEENRRDKDKREHDIVPLGLEFQHAHGMWLGDTFYALYLALEGIRGFLGRLRRLNR